MDFTVRPELKMMYPTAVFGGLSIANQGNKEEHPGLEQAKHRLEARIRDDYPDPGEDPVVHAYAGYFGRWGKTYPIEYQIKSVKKGRSFPRVSTHVDCMFMAELEDRVLTSGHDMDAVQGVPVYDLADDCEEYVKLNGKKQVLVKNDVVLRDDEGVLASVLFGPAARTSIGMGTVNPLYFAWCPVGISREAVDEHLSNVLGYLRMVHGEGVEETRLVI
jgi:DNA/RNA-binding domain of Phe-tRNA-synthetase-like protein